MRLARSIHILKADLAAECSNFGSFLSPHPTLTLQRQIQQHVIIIDRTTHSGGTSRPAPEQPDLSVALPRNHNRTSARSPQSRGRRAWG